MDERIRKFKEDCKGFEKTVDKIYDRLREGYKEINAEDSLKIKELGVELEGLSNEAKTLIEEIRRSGESIDSTKTIKEIEAIIDNLKQKLKELKIRQLDRYNLRVDSINSRINELNARSDFSPEAMALLKNLKLLSPVFVVIKSWRHISYVKDLDYEALIRMERLIEEINGKSNIVKKDTTVLDDMSRHINIYLEDCKKKVNGDMSDADKKFLTASIEAINLNILYFEEKLLEYKDKLSEDEYKEYAPQIEEYKERLEEIKLHLTNQYEIYQRYSLQASMLFDEAQSLNREIALRAGNMNAGAITLYNNKIVLLRDKIDNFEEEIKKAHDNNEINDAVYTAMMNEVKRVRLEIQNAQQELNKVNPVDVDIFTYIATEIDDIDNQLTKLEEVVSKFDKKKNDKNERKQIEQAIRRLSIAIAQIESKLEENKEIDEEKYKVERERVERLKERLAKLDQNYHKNLPLRVQRIKSAKEFYKKHKKAVLIGTGLAAVALIHATVGPVIIPAIMHGNLMLHMKIPALRPLLNSINALLGKAINANIVKIGGVHFWQLANGVTLNPACASTSILKGLAISGIGTAALVAPVVAAVKELTNKMKTAALKEKLATKATGDETERVNPKPKKKPMQKIKDKVIEKVRKPVNDGRKVYDEIKDLIMRYRESNLSFEEFCEREDLDEKKKQILRIYIDMLDERKKGGRK